MLMFKFKKFLVKTSLIEHERRSFLIFDQQNLVYLKTPKVACSSILLTISEYYGVKVNPSIHYDNFWHVQRGKLNKNSANYYKFTFIRNPFDRLVSCYKSKILLPYNLKQPPHFNAPYFSTIQPNSSFADFVQSIANIPDFMADQHFKSQYAILYDKNKLLVDWIGRFENLEADWAELAKKYNFKPDLAYHNSSHNVENTYQDYRLYYTKELADMVYKRYQKDVELLGYSHAYQKLLDFLEKS